MIIAVRLFLTLSPSLFMDPCRQELGHPFVHVPWRREPADAHFPGETGAVGLPIARRWFSEQRIALTAPAVEAGPGSEGRQV